LDNLFFICVLCDFSILAALFFAPWRETGERSEQKL
jgi:hypothetical protein